VDGSPHTGNTGPFAISYDPYSLPLIKAFQHGDLIWYTSLHNHTVLVASRTQQTVNQNGGDYVIKKVTIDECSNAKFINMMTVQTNTTQQVILTGQVCNGERFTLLFQAVTTDEGYDHLHFNLTVESSYYNEIKLVYGCMDDEQFYGLGVQYTHFSLRGHTVPVFISEQGVGRGVEPITLLLDVASPGAGGTPYTTYSRVPFYVTNYNNSLLLESNDYAKFHIPLIGDSLSIELNNTILYGRIIKGDSPMDILQSYTSYTGRMRGLPDWVHNGAILGLQGGTKIVSDVLELVKGWMGDLKDVTAVWLQDWSGQRNITGNKDLPRTGLWWNWEVDSSHYPGWNEFIQTLYSQDIRVMTYINPLIINVTNRGTPYQHNYYDEGIANGYFVKTSDGEIWTGYSNSAMVDLTNPRAYEWIKNMIIENMLATNVSGWMCDFGESLPLNAQLYDRKISPSQFHTLYSAVWGELNAQSVTEAAQKNLITNQQASDIVYFMRSGSTFSAAKTTLFWVGDQLTTWDQYDGLASSVTGMLSSGISGFTLTHSDTGGYTALKFPGGLKYIRDKELFWRWCELSAFTTIYRTHQGTLPDENWQFYTDIDTMKHFFHMSRVFMSWKFYRDTLVKEAANYGWPVARHMFLVFPSNQEVHVQDLRYQYMLGTELLVAPVVHKGVTTKSVFLPRGITWIHVWTNESYKGDNEWVEIKAQLGYPVVLYPNGSTVGLQFVKNLKMIKLIKDEL
jgi:alpha-glucosidase (family GH31 glycosyl hydrolase)